MRAPRIGRSAGAGRVRRRFDRSRLLDLLLVAVPIARAWAAPRLGLDPLGPVARLLAAHPWVQQLVAIPLAEAHHVSDALTLLGVLVAIAAGLAASGLARATGLGAASPLAGIAFEFAPGMPVLGFDQAGLALACLPLPALAVLRLADPARASAPRLAGAIALVLGFAGSALAVAVGLFTLLWAVPLTLSRIARGRRRGALVRLFAGLLLGALLAFPFAVAHLLFGLPSAAGSWLARLPGVGMLPGGRAIAGPHLFVGLLGTIGPGLAALASTRGRTRGFGGALGVGLVACVAWSLWRGPIALLGFGGLAGALLFALAATTPPTRRGAEGALAAGAVLLLAAWAASLGVPARAILVGAGLLGLPVIVRLSAGRVAGAAAGLASLAAGFWLAP